MPKLKTNKAARKRFRVTRNKKILGNKSFRRHLNADKSSKRKRQARRKRHVDNADKGKILRMLPYGN